MSLYLKLNLNVSARGSTLPPAQSRAPNPARQAKKTLRLVDLPTFLAWLATPWPSSEPNYSGQLKNFFLGSIKIAAG